MGEEFSKCKNIEPEASHFFKNAERNVNQKFNNKQCAQIVCNCMPLKPPHPGSTTINYSEVLFTLNLMIICCPPDLHLISQVVWMFTLTYYSHSIVHHALARA